MSHDPRIPDSPPQATLVERFPGRFPGHAMRRLRLPDGRYRYLHVSPGVSEFGLDPVQLVALETVTHEWIHAEDRPKFLKALERSAAGLTTLDEEVRVVRPDGTVKWVRSIGEPKRLEDGSVLWDGVALDVTDRREAMEKVEKAMLVAREAEASASAFSRQAVADLTVPLVELRQALHGSEGVDLESARGALASIERLLGLDAQGSQATTSPTLEIALTGRQAEIARMVAQGMKNRDIAAVLDLSEGTVKLHVSAVLKKLGLRNRAQIARFALLSG